jgi:hypothetical protein
MWSFVHRKDFRTPNRQDQESTSPHHSIIKVLIMQNRERIRKTAKEKNQVKKTQAHKSKTICVLQTLKENNYLDYSIQQRHPS